MSMRTDRGLLHGGMELWRRDEHQESQGQKAVVLAGCALRTEGPARAQGSVDLDLQLAHAKGSIHNNAIRLSQSIN